MAIVAADIHFRLSNATGPGNSTAGTPATSLGGFMSSTDMSTGANTLFDDISGAENAASTVDYRSFFVLNDHATLALQNAVIYQSSEVAGGANITIATDNLGPLSKTSASAMAGTIANETTAPSGVSAYSAPTTSATGLALGNVSALSAKGVWAKRTATNSAALNGDGVTFAVSGDTAA